MELGITIGVPAGNIIKAWKYFKTTFKTAKEAAEMMMKLTTRKEKENFIKKTIASSLGNAAFQILGINDVIKDCS